MSVLHVENDDNPRDALARLVKEEVDGVRLISVSNYGEAEKRLRGSGVQLLILDLGLNPTWDNRNLPRVLRRLAEGLELDPQDAEHFYAFRLARLAHDRGVPCVLLTAFPEHLRLDGARSEALRNAFHAQAVFKKDEAGLTECAAWVGEHLG
jgi:CheY-like chemotaxis protein